MASILIADDEEEVRNLLRKTLEKKGHAVSEAANGNEALEALGREQVDLLLLDLIMPEKGGLETLMDIRQAHPDLSVIVITGEVDTTQDSFSSFLGQFNVKAVLNKPFSMKQLLRVVKNALSS